MFGWKGLIGPPTDDWEQQDRYLSNTFMLVTRHGSPPLGGILGSCEYSGDTVAFVYKGR